MNFLYRRPGRLAAAADSPVPRTLPAIGDNVAAASFHITTAVKNQVVGVKGALNNPTALSLVYAPSSCLTVNTDMTKYDISYHLVSTQKYFKYFVIYFNFH